MNELDNDNSLSATDKAIFVDIFYNKEKPRDLAEKYGKELKDIVLIKNSVLSKFKRILQNEYQIQHYSDISE